MNGTRYVALLRAISNLRVQPFRDALEEMGFTDVSSYGTTGNLVFTSTRRDAAALERDIGARLGYVTLVRTRREVARVAAADPFRGKHHAACVLFLSRIPTAAKRRAFREVRFQSPRPVLLGKTLFYEYPARLEGRKSPADLERLLGVRATFRTSRVVQAILQRL